MSRADTWMPLYIGDYLADTMHLEAREHGAYLLLIMHYWRNGPLPDDASYLARIARCSDDDWQAISSCVLSFFKAKKGKVLHKRIDIELKRAKNNSKKRSLSGKLGAAAKAENAKQNHAAASNCQVFAGSLPEVRSTPSPSPSPSKEESKQEPPALRAAPPQRGSRLPVNWEPGDEGWHFAIDLGLSPNAVLGKFRDHWAAQPGQKGVKVDWPATWRNWCRTDAERRKGKPGSGQSPADVFGVGRDDWAQHANLLGLPQ